MKTEGSLVTRLTAMLELASLIYEFRPADSDSTRRGQRLHGVFLEFSALERGCKIHRLVSWREHKSHFLELTLKWKAVPWKT